MYELLASYRKTVDSYYPDLKSEEAKNALKMYKRLVKLNKSEYVVKSALSSDEVLFYRGYSPSSSIKSWYTMSQLPGWKEGISASLFGGNDVGITNYINEERKKASVKVLEYFMSKEKQKEMVMIENANFRTLMNEVNYDEDVCSKYPCELYRNLQYFPNFGQERVDYDEYSENFRDIMFEYFSGNATLDEALEKFIDLYSVYHITLDTENTSYGLIMYVIITSLLLLIIISSPLISMRPFKRYFKFLPMDFWYVIILGILCHVASNYTDYGEILEYKCRLKIFLYSIGFTLIFVPLLYKMVINFPDDNKISTWISNHRYVFLFVFIFLDILLTLCNLDASYGSKIIESGNGKKYEECKMRDSLAKTVVYLSIGYKLFIFLGISFFAFIEWNLEETAFDIHFSILSIYINILSFVMIIILKYIKFTSYITYSILNKMFIIIIILSNYIVFIGIRLVIKYIGNGKKEREFSVHTSSNNTKISQLSKTSDGRTSLANNYHKLIQYHYQTSSTAVPYGSGSTVGSVTSSSKPNIATITSSKPNITTLTTSKPNLTKPGDI